MKAAVIRNYGGPEQLEIVHTHLKPTITKPTQVLVKIHYAAVNPLDAKLCRGLFSMVVRNEFPFVLGQDFAGVVEAVGDEVHACESLYRQI